jgi:histone H3/H4
MSELTIQPLRRLFKRAGAKRISDKAAEELAKELELRAKEIVIEAKNLAEHSGRRTILRRDIKMARRIKGK